MSKPATRSDILAGMATGGLAPAMAAIVTNPADVAKTRLNMSRELQPGRVGSVAQCWRAIVAAEGLAGLQRGLGFVLVREASKNTFRLGLYEPLVSALDSAAWPAAALDDPVRGAAPPAMTSRVAAGAISGGLAAFLCNPLDLLKTRIQLDPARGAGRTASEALQQLVAAEGVAGLWRRGMLANVARSAAATSLGLPVNYRLKEAVNANAAHLPLLAARPAVRDAACALVAAAVVRSSSSPAAPSAPTGTPSLPLCAPIHPAHPAPLCVARSRSPSTRSTSCARASSHSRPHCRRRRHVPPRCPPPPPRPPRRRHQRRRRHHRHRGRRRWRCRLRPRRRRVISMRSTVRDASLRPRAWAPFGKGPSQPSCGLVRTKR